MPSPRKGCSSSSYAPVVARISQPVHIALDLLHDRGQRHPRRALCTTTLGHQIADVETDSSPSKGLLEPQRAREPLAISCKAGNMDVNISGLRIDGADPCERGRAPLLSSSSSSRRTHRQARVARRRIHEGCSRHSRRRAKSQKQGASRSRVDTRERERETATPLSHSPSRWRRSPPLRALLSDDDDDDDDDSSQFSLGASMGFSHHGDSRH